MSASTTSTSTAPAAPSRGGESQRIRLASQIGSGLSGVLYVLDEPSIGLHQKDNDRLLETLKRLRGLGNTVLVVEHDEEAIRTADHVIDMGPGAGVHGGEVVCAGTLDDLLACKDSLTADYLTGRREIPLRATRRKGSGKSVTVHGATANNLQNVTAAFPLGTFTCVTGVSGSGKSSLTIDTLYAGAARALNGARIVCGPCSKITGLEQLDKVIDIDQSPIGRTPRSNPATYTGAFTQIRDWFAGLPESKARGYKPGRFSFNVKGGRCEACQGDGLIKIEMHFLPDVYVTCDVCHGARYNRETLEVKFKGHSIADVLDMNVEEAAELFKAVPAIRDKMRMLQEVGLGYIKVGQSATTLSGGEAQRVKLSKELSRRATGKTLYILDEPTTGLHFEDVRKLLEVLHAPGRAGQYGGGDRAQPRRHQDRGLGDRPRARRRRERRQDHRRRAAGSHRRSCALCHGSVSETDAGARLRQTGRRPDRAQTAETRAKACPERRRRGGTGRTRFDCGKVTVPLRRQGPRRAERMLSNSPFGLELDPCFRRGTEERGPRPGLEL